MDRVVSTPEIDKSTIPEAVTPPLIASWILAGIALLLIPFFHLISALVAGLLVYELVSLLAPIIERHLINRWSRDRKSTRLNSSHRSLSRMPSSA